MVATVATAILRLSSRTAGQKVITNTDPERHSENTTSTQRTTFCGMIHKIWKRQEKGCQRGCVLCDTSSLPAGLCTN